MVLKGYLALAALTVRLSKIRSALAKLEEKEEQVQGDLLKITEKHGKYFFDHKGSRYNITRVDRHPSAILDDNKFKEIIINKYGQEVWMAISSRGPRLPDQSKINKALVTGLIKASDIESATVYGKSSKPYIRITVK